MRSVPQEYSIQKFYQYAGSPKYNRSTRTYSASCPLCREGSSWGRKRRLYYILDDDYIYCHNCGWSGSPIKFIQENSTLTVDDIVAESAEFDILPVDISTTEETLKRVQADTLPRDSINLFDEQQIQYYKNNTVVNQCLDIVTKRRISTSINRPKTIWVSLEDYTHKNRLVFPFYGLNGDILFYQTRTVLNTDNKHYPKYLSKANSDKTLFNIDKVQNGDTIFIFEGPIDACFVQNGIALAGINESSSTMFTQTQRTQLAQFGLYKQIWALDSQWQDTASYNKTKKLIDSGEIVFLWPEEYGKRFKDFNDMAIALNLDEIPQSFIIDHSYQGIKASLIASQIQTSN